MHQEKERKSVNENRAFPRPLYGSAVRAKKLAGQVLYLPLLYAGPSFPRSPLSLINAITKSQRRRETIDRPPGSLILAFMASGENRPVNERGAEKRAVQDIEGGGVSQEDEEAECEIQANSSVNSS